MSSVEHDCLKLTTYFGERDRTPDGLLSDELMSLYARHGLRCSVLLRGADGFGRLHHLRTDRMLSSSEDLPVVAIAVDERARIEALLEAVLDIKRHGLITLERARLLANDGEGIGPASEADEMAKLTIYLGRHDRIGGRPAHVTACAMLHDAGIAGASVLLGVDGTLDGERYRARLLGRNRNVPMLLLALGTRKQLAEVLPKLRELLGDPPITLERVRVCKRDGRSVADLRELPGKDEHGLALWQKLTIYTPHDATHLSQPLHLEMLARLQRRTAVAGATVLRGIWGFHGDHPPYGDRVFQVHRHVPVMTIVIDTPERIRESYPIIDELTAEHGLVTSEIVPAAQATSAERRYGGLRLARHLL